MTEGHMVDFVGWLKLCREQGERTVSIQSVPRYFSSVLQMHTSLTGTKIPSFPYLGIVLRAYRKWEKGTFPGPNVRCGLSATVMQQV